MSGPQARPFKGRLGFDANNDKVVNLADPTAAQDGVNKRWFIENNTVQTFDATRGYPIGFVVEYSDRLFKSKEVIGVGPFNLNQWTEIHAFGRWLRITGAYTADPGDNLYVSTFSGAVTITLPSPAEDGDIVTILDEGYAKTNPINIVAAGGQTIGNTGSTYAINSQDIIQFIYLGGTWRVSREEKASYNYVTAAVVLTPNSYNLVKANPVKTLQLPPTPAHGQWVTVVDADTEFGLYYNTISGNGKNIDGKTSFVLNRFGGQATFIYDSNIGQWKAVTNQLEKRFANEGQPLLVSQSVTYRLDNTTKNVTLPTAQAGDWVELIVDETPVAATGQIVVTAPAGQTLEVSNGDGSPSTTYRIKRRGRTLFVLRGSVWSITQIDNMRNDTRAQIRNGTINRNSLTYVYSSADQTIYLPSTDSIQVGEYMTAVIQVDTPGQRVEISVADNSGYEILNGPYTIDGFVATFTEADNGKVVSFIFRGYNGGNTDWLILDHGSAYLQRTKNLDDLPNKAIARTNLDVFSKGESDNRFLPLHGTADRALQADNADKLDNLDSADFIQVVNPSTVAVDANTSLQGRFTTNINTPDATMWQVTMFVDKATGSKYQLAMHLTDNFMAARVWIVGLATWSGWTRLDESANVASATKLQTARNISLTGDATGQASFDGTTNAAIPVNNVKGSLKQVAVTAVNASNVVAWTRIASITQPIAEDSEFSFQVMTRRTGVGPAGSWASYCYFRARSSQVYVTWNGFGHELGCVVSDTATDKTVDIYIKHVTQNNISHIFEISRALAPAASLTWFSEQAVSATEPSGYAVGVNNKQYGDNYHPLADKWTTPRKIIVTGAHTGEVTFDGSQDATLNLSTIDETYVPTLQISKIEGLQEELDSKSSATGKAPDSELLDGLDSSEFKRVQTSGVINADPNTTLEGFLLTNHANTPNGGTTYWYITTEFYAGRTTSTNRYQIAKQYNGGAAVWVRNYYGSWSAWTALQPMMDGTTYNASITGNAATATVATRLQTPRTINGVAFDGTANITVADSTKLPLAGGVMTGPVKRVGASGTNFRKYDNVFNYSTETGSVTGTMCIRLPVGMQNSMIKFRVNIFDYKTNTGNQILEIQGCNYGTGWTNCSVVGNDTSLSAPTGENVRFGTNGTYAYVLIGSTASVWNYPKVSIENVTIGYSGAADAAWDNAWDVTFATSEAGMTVHSTNQISPYVAKVERANIFTQEQRVTATGTYLRSVVGNYGFMLYNDGSSFYMMKTAAGDQYGSYDATRPFYINLASGAVTMGTAVTMSSTLNVNGNFWVGQNTTTAALSVTGVSAFTGASTFTGAATFNGSCYNGNWYRSTGATGWYNETYAGGIYMMDTTWVRVYNSKAFYVANEIAATGNITAYYSDARLKENLEVIPNALETVKSWTGYKYNANNLGKTFGYDPEKKEVGLLAQEVQKTTPEAVEQAPFDRTDKKGESLTGQHYLTLKYERLVPVLVEAIKEQDKEIQALKEQVASLIEAFKGTRPE